MIISMRTIFAVVLMMTLSYVSNAQSNDLFTFGIKAGANRSTINISGTRPKIAPNFGLFTQYKASETIAVRSELSYSILGARSKKNATEKTKLKLNYIQVFPALLRVYPTKKIGLEVGPYGGYLLSAKGASKSDYRKIDYGGTVGLAYHISDNLEIGARYVLGIRDITNANSDAKNRALQLALSYSF
ncbi:porin family protein [Seonamhaeicola marinus]|uniref:PorT family protein n=1 Tax=Seonamhaeicola marinus TaxID=1912246 RepID=A0A5D0HKV6_9FLAO|nr:porin family protein [Seonamhaeicola marinus]TYA71951.1 PorT family protein [Seonamhaeicola marinus]